MPKLRVIGDEPPVDHFYGLYKLLVEYHELTVLEEVESETGLKGEIQVARYCLLKMIEAGADPLELGKATLNIRYLVDTHMKLVGEKSESELADLFQEMLGGPLT
jgi:hypothetical protein